MQRDISEHVDLYTITQSLTIVGKLLDLLGFEIVRKVLAAAIARILGENLCRVRQELGDKGIAFLGGGVGGKSKRRHVWGRSSR